MSRAETEYVNERVDRVTKLLRVCGSLVLVASASTFMVQRWDGQGDVVKFAFLLAHTVMALGAGLLCAATIRESRAARTFLLLALALVPMNFAVSGGFVYSAFALDGAATALPRFATWVAPGPLFALGIAVLTTLVTALTSAVALVPLIRGHVRAFLARFLAANLCLLVPLRAPELAGLCAVGAGLFALWFELGRARDSRLGTPEGRLLRALCWVPCLLVLGRSGLFYGASAFLYTPFVAALGIWAFVSAKRFQKLAGLFEMGGAVLTAASWLPLAVEVKMRWFPDEPVHPQVVLGASIVLLVMSHWAVATRETLRPLGCALGLLVCAFGVVVDPGLGSGLVTFLFAIAVACYGMLVSSRPLEITATLVAVSGLVCAVSCAIGFDSLLNWGSLSILGLLLVFAAAVIERRRGLIVARFQALPNQRSSVRVEEMV